MPPLMPPLDDGATLQHRLQLRPPLLVRRPLPPSSPPRREELYIAPAPRLPVLLIRRRAALSLARLRMRLMASPRERGAGRGGAGRGALLPNLNGRRPDSTHDGSAHVSQPHRQPPPPPPAMSIKKNAAAATVELPSLETSSAADGQLDAAFFAETSAKFLGSDKNRLAQNVIARLDVQEAAIDLEASKVNHHFSCSLREQWDVEGLATSQAASGRCWLFAMLNTLRYPIIRALDLPSDFELSQSHLFYWDKVERANFFLETMIETADEPFDSRLIQWLCSQPVSDGGQWDMCVNLIVKHGVMPKEAFPETFTSSSSARMNYMLTNKLREFASELRLMASSGADIEQMRATKDTMMETINDIIMIHLGTPPTTFDWSYTDTKKKFHKMTKLSPQSFYAEVCPVDVTTKVSLINDPRNEYFKLRVHQCPPPQYDVRGCL